MYPNQLYECQVTWSQSLGRWVARFEDVKIGLTVEFPLTDHITNYDYGSSHGGKRMMERLGSATQEKMQALGLVFLRLVQNKTEMIESQLAGAPATHTALEKALTTPETPAS